MKYKILSALAVLTLAGAACSNITDINTNPNGPVDVPPPSILPNVQQNILTNYVFNTGLNVRYGGLWAQHFSEIQYRDEDKYIVRPGTTGGWNMYFQGLEDAQRMIVKGIASNTPNWEAVGRIMKSYAFSIMTDAMGDLPYTDALKGDDSIPNLQPAYDTQKVIYDSLFASLTKASTEIDPAGIGFSSGDLMYGGDMTEWRKLANSLRLRLAIHIVNADPAKAQAEAVAAINAGVFTSNDDNAGLQYLAAPPNQNPIYTNHLTRDDYGMSMTLVDSLLSWNDPRLPIYADTNQYGAYRGLPNGLNDGAGATLDSISRYGAYWRKTPGAPMYFITYAEVLLLEAEAAERGWTGGNAATLYQQAITASMEQYGISGADITTYLGGANVGYNAKGATQAGHLQQIAYQLWVALYMNGMEAWTEWRRTQVPSLMPGIDVVVNAGVLNGIPERLPYNDQEEVLNQQNVDAAVARQGLTASNDILTPLWFTGRAP